MEKQYLADLHCSPRSKTTDEHIEQQQQQSAKHFAKDVPNRPPPLAQAFQESSSGDGGRSGATAAKSSPDDFSAGEYYEEYLSSVLFDFGLQLSPGGTQVEEIEQTQDFDQIKDDLEQCSQVRASKRELSPNSQTADTGGNSATTFPSSKFQKVSETHKIRAKTQEELGIVSSGSADKGIPATASPSLPSTLPPIPALQPLAGSSVDDSSTSKKKIKKYEVTEPLEDPELEKRRLNAINARKHRVRHKMQTQELSDKNKKLENVVRQCSKALKRTISDVQKLKLGLEEEKSDRFALEQQLKKKENEVREQREKLALFRGHLDLIASSLDDDNPARKLITSVVRKLPTDLSRMQAT